MPRLDKQSQQPEDQMFDAFELYGILVAEAIMKIFGLEDGTGVLPEDIQQDDHVLTRAS